MKGQNCSRESDDELESEEDGESEETDWGTFRLVATNEPRFVTLVERGLLVSVTLVGIWLLTPPRTSPNTLLALIMVLLVASRQRVCQVYVDAARIRLVRRWPFSADLIEFSRVLFVKRYSDHIYIRTETTKYWIGSPLFRRDSQNFFRRFEHGIVDAVRARTGRDVADASYYF